MKEAVKLIALTFFLVTTCSLFGTALFTTIFFKNDTFTSALLWQILGISFLTAMASLIFTSKSILTKRGVLLRQGIHFLLILSILMGGALKFEWIHITVISEISFFILLVIVVYITVCTILYQYEIKNAEEINERIKELQGTEKEELSE